MPINQIMTCAQSTAICLLIVRVCSDDGHYGEGNRGWFCCGLVRAGKALGWRCKAQLT